MGFVGIHVVDAASGQTLYSHNEDRLFLPASNFKLVTSALAMERLGPEYRFTTKLLREASGDLVLAGAGDPAFSRREYPYAAKRRSDRAKSEERDPIEALADQVAMRGIARIDGDIVGDDRLFAWEPYPPSWTEDDRQNDYGAPVSALSLNDNVVSVSIEAGARAGDPAKAAVSFEYLTIENRVVTGARGSESRVRAEQVAGSRQWVLTGSVALGAAASGVAIPVDDPALYAASALYDALTRRGIAIRGRAVARHRAKGEAYLAPMGEEIASRVSPPLLEIVQAMDKESINLHAELLLRETGRAAKNDGSNAGGLAALGAFLKEIGAANADWRAEDGSGLARNDLVTPRLLTQLLVRGAGKFGDAWISLLPAGGEEGTLDHRLCCMSEGRGVRAKTGTLDRALTLSGYADSKGSGRLAFSILVNDFSAPAGAVRDWIDKITTALLE